MESLIGHISNYSDTTKSLQFYSKDEAINFINNFENTNNFKYFKHKGKLLGNTVAQHAPNNANGILKNATIALPLKCLSNFWRLFKIPLINCKIELILKWTKYYVLSTVGNDNTNANPNNITFTMKDTKLYFPVVTLSARDKPKLSKLLAKEFERSVYWNEHKTKVEDINTANK